MKREFIAVVLVAVLVLAIVTGVSVWLLAQTGPGGPLPPNPAVELAPYQTNLEWPSALAFAPDGRVFYAERLSGAIRIIANSAVLPTPFYTLTGTETAGERGLLGLALDPAFPSSPWVYAYQTYDDFANGTVYNRIVRIQASGDTGLSHSVILQMPPLSGATNHNGGVIAFGPDGRLYALVGENADTSLSQNPMSLLGKVLRMNSDGTAPSDNPFYGNLSWENRVYTYGHRNMFGIAFQPGSGRGYITENGPQDSDELNRLEPGGNYGWPAVRGIANTAPYIDPLIAYTPVIVPTNAAFYTGSVLPASTGHLIFGDYRGRLHDVTLEPDGTAVVRDDILIDAGTGIVDVEMGLDGTIWLTTASAIFRAVPAPVSPYAVLSSPVGVVAAPASNSPSREGLAGLFDRSGRA